MARQRVDDAGQYLPGAAKEKAVTQALVAELAGIERGARDSIPEYDALSSVDIWWPEPDWRVWVEEGLPAQLAADLFFLRSNLPNRPPAPSFGIDAAAWSRMYERAADAMQHVLATLKTNDTFETLQSRFEATLGWTSQMIQDRKFDRERALAPYGLGRLSGRKLRHPFALSPLQQVRRPVIARLGWPLDPDIPAQPTWLPVELVNRESGVISWRVCQVSGKGYLPESEAFDDDEMAIIDTILRIKAEARELETGKSSPYDRPSIGSELIRTGPDWRGGRDATADEFLQQFGFRGIQFGNWVPQRERQTLLNQAWDALSDLMDVCQLPARAASLNGFIVGIAFGARGKPGAAAHWEPDRQIMHFTRHRGAGAIAHEWGHAVDNYLGGLAYQSTVDAMPEYRHTAAAIAKYRREAYLTTIRDSVRTFPETKAMQSIKLAMCNLQGLDDPFAKNRATYLRHAVQIDGLGKPYWRTPKELWARAFEAWVYDSLEASDRRSDYLVFGVDEERWRRPKAPSPYPLDEERALIGGRINSAMKTWRPLLSGESGEATDQAVLSPPQNPPRKRAADQ